MADDQHEDEEQEEEQGTEGATAWHPLLIKVLEEFLPAGWKLHAEMLLNRLPQRVDIVVIRLEETPVGQARKIRSIFDHLRNHTLIEHKGPTDDLQAADALTLMAYAGQYMRLHKVHDPGQVGLMVVADRMPVPFIQQVERMEGKFVPMGRGLWRGQLAGLSLHGVELRVVHESDPSERLLYAFSRSFLSNPGRMELVDDDDTRVYHLLCQQVEQFRRSRATMALREIDLANEKFKSALRKVVEQLPPEERLAGLSPEARLAGLTPEARLAGLPPEARLAGLTPQQILAVLPPEVRELVLRESKEQSS